MTQIKITGVHIVDVQYSFCLITTCASDTFTNVFSDNFAARSYLKLIWYSISSMLNASPVWILLEAAPDTKLLASDEISITGSPIVIFFFGTIYFVIPPLTISY